VRSVERLRPDLVVLEREENRRETHDELQAAGIPCLVVHVTGVAGVPGMLEDLGEAVGRAGAARALAAEVRLELERSAAFHAGVERRIVGLPLIWREPLMAIAPSRYGGDLVGRSGFVVPDPSPGDGYPVVTPARAGELGVEVLLLSSEPHDFTPAEGEAVADAVREAGHARPVPLKVDGEALTWFGARTAAALRWWRALRASLPR
jgi:ABC-type Fe3+-hydroxamate transport system substrate-binding protein